MRKLLILVIFVLTNITYAQVGIGNTTPDTDTILDITSTNKGVLVPRVDITAVSLAAPLSTNIKDGTLIYCPGTFLTEGFYFWNNNQWNLLDTVITKNTYNITTSGGADGDTNHPIPADTCKFETFDGNWADGLILPTVSASNSANRLNEFITIQKRSFTAVTIRATNTDMETDLILGTNASPAVSDETATFMFDGTKWNFISVSN